MNTHQTQSTVGQATSQNQQIQTFFSKLSDTGITNFFSNSPQRIAILDKTVNKIISHGSAVGWNLMSQTIMFMDTVDEMHRRNRIIIHNRYSNKSIRGYPVYVVFWLTVFHNIMPLVKMLYSKRHKTSTDATQIRKHVNTFQQSAEQKGKGWT